MGQVMAGKKNHPGFNEHPAVQKGEGHKRPAEGHAGVDRMMFGGRGGGNNRAAAQGTPGPQPEPMQEGCGE